MYTQIKFAQGEVNVVNSKGDSLFKKKTPEQNGQSVWRMDENFSHHLVQPQ